MFHSLNVDPNKSSGGYCIKEDIGFCEWKKLIQKASSRGCACSVEATLVADRSSVTLLLIWAMNCPETDIGCIGLRLLCLVKRKIDLVYGGGSVGLMGLISQKVYDGGCHVLGVIPKALMPHEISGETVGQVRTVSDMHERKAVMAREADAFIALPGGYGTMEELLEMITWSQLGIHKKPVGLLNVDGYYNSLLALFDNGVEEGFIKPGARHIVLSAPTANMLLEKMEQYTPSHQQVAPHESWDMKKLALFPGQQDAQ